MNSRKIVYALISALALVSAAYAVEVDEDEIRSISNSDVVFENYVGPHSVINTIEEIRAIGSGIGNVVAQNTDRAGTYGYAPKYAVIHAIDPEETGKLDADILVIGPNAIVDHITNMRRIISAYLTAAYGYSRQDADTVATFVTVYNAVYRGKLDMFRQKYKKIVTDNLTEDKVGIALSYRDWPGMTQLVIPLYDINGGLSTVDTSVISEKEVIASMQEDEDKGIEDRKGMVDIKEREADEAAERAAAEQAKADEAAKKAADEKAKADAAKKAADEKAKQAEAAKKTADDAQKKAAENPADKQAQKDARAAADDAKAKQAEADQAKATSDEQQQKADEQQQKADEQQQKADTAQNTADQKRSEAQEERSAIAKDQQQVIAQQEKNENAPTVYGLTAEDELGQRSAIVRMNATTGELIKKSPVTVIQSRTFYENGNTFIAIAGENIGNGTVKLVHLNKDTLEIVKESNETIAANSVLVQDGGSYYCVMQDGTFFVVGKFSANLENQLKSPVRVKPTTPITVTQNGIIVTSMTGTPILLNKADLTQLSQKSRSDTIADKVISTIDAK
ncbi:MAG: hypothetical protein K2N31_02500 [Treponemataceae bacterium]|nr:hypothetical protein [Treponemataceae bacterium]